MNLELHLRIVGVLLFALLSLNFVLPRRFRWREELGRLSLFNRQIFIVHAMFICLILAMFGALSLFWAPLLLESAPLPRVVLAGLALFWFARLLVQWFVYDRSLWRGKRFETAVHFVFTGVWLYFCTTYALALWSNLRG
jgi:hypothetical protein